MRKSKIKSTVLIASLSLLCMIGKAQEKKADKMFDHYAYIDALKTYERIVEKGYKSSGILKKIGDSYYFNGLLAESAKWYGDLFALNDQSVEPEYYYRYAQSLKATGQYEKANQILDQFSKKSADQIRTKIFLENGDYLNQIKSNSGRYTVKSVDLNSEFSDFGTAFFGDKIVFASNREAGNMQKKIDKWTDNSFAKIYVTEVNKNGFPVGQGQKLSKNIDYKFHESTAVFTKDGKTMYFTRNSKKNDNENKESILKVYRAKLVNNDWSDVEELSINGSNFNTAHPALSPDEKTLYFASNRPGTFGSSDIFKTEILDNGKFGEPVNMGNEINTEGRETFPFVAESGELYFSTDGHQGLGGLDVFVAPKDDKGGYLKVYNIGEPVNSPFDDFAFIINSTGKGFFSSNRTGGKGYDDIYSINETKKIEYVREQLLAGLVTDTDTGKILADTEVLVYDKDFNLISQTKTDASGKYALKLKGGTLYYVRAQKKDYVTKEQTVVTPDVSGETALPIALEKIIRVVHVNDDLAKVFNIEYIYFDFDKADLRPDAVVDLQKVIDVMQQYPTMKIDVRSYTDSKGMKKYNKKLSDLRAQSIIEYMTKNGISSDRISGRGYGETKLLNKCKDGVKCSEEEHQKNRRGEFIITKI